MIPRKKKCLSGLDLLLFLRGHPFTTLPTRGRGESSRPTYHAWLKGGGGSTKRSRSTVTVKNIPQSIIGKKKIAKKSVTLCAPSVHSQRGGMAEWRQPYSTNSP